MGIPVTRSVWSASSLLALSLGVGAPKAETSSTHSKRFASRNVRALPQYVTELKFQSTKQHVPPEFGDGWFALVERQHGFAFPPGGSFDSGQDRSRSWHG